jgi:hypothetical protein
MKREQQTVKIKEDIDVLTASIRSLKEKDKKNK